MLGESAQGQTLVGIAWVSLVSRLCATDYEPPAVVVTACFIGGYLSQPNPQEGRRVWHLSRVRLLLCIGAL